MRVGQRTRGPCRPIKRLCETVDDGRLLSGTECPRTLGWRSLCAYRPRRLSDDPGADQTDPSARALSSLWMGALTESVRT